MKRWTGWLAALCCLMLLCGVAVAQEGSWGQINQSVERPEGWQQIVKDSPFALGDTVELGEIGGQMMMEQSFGTYPSLDGSTVAVPMALEFARQMLSLAEEDLPGFVFFSTTHNAYVHLIEKQENGSPMIASQNVAMEEGHPVDLIIATEPSDEELALAEEHGVTLVQKPVCYDAFVFITHVDNPVESLTVEEIRKIYQGEITNWKEVGGEDSPIDPYQREPNSGSQTAMEKLVMQGEQLKAAVPTYVVDGMSGLVERIGSYDNSARSLGYTYKYYIDTLYKNDAIKIIAIDGVSPTDENLRSATYPFTTSYYGVHRAGEEQETGGLFLDWMLSEEGQRCIQQAGYIPVTALPDAP